MTLNEKIQRLQAINTQMEALKAEQLQIIDGDITHEIGHTCCPFVIGDIVLVDEPWADSTMYEVIRIDSTMEKPFYNVMGWKLKKNNSRMQTAGARKWLSGKLHKLGTVSAAA